MFLPSTKKKFDVLEMKMVTAYKKKKIIWWGLLTPWWIESNLPIMTSKIELWNEGDKDHMMKEGEEENWFS